jgi:predicted RNA-binding protein with TRAM domain
MYENRFSRSAPVNEGDELDVKIEALGEKGDGIAKKNGFVLVVPGTQVNDEVKIKVTKVLRKVGFAEVIGKAESKPETEKNEAPKRPAKKEMPSEEGEEMQEEESEEIGSESEEEFSDDEMETGEDSENFGEEDQ